MRETPRAAAQEKFTSAEDEITYLRERIAQKERELETSPDQFEKQRIAHRELAEYAQVPEATILHEAVVMVEQIGRAHV